MTRFVVQLNKLVSGTLSRTLLYQFKPYPTHTMPVARLSSKAFELTIPTSNSCVHKRADLCCERADFFADLGRNAPATLKASDLAGTPFSKRRPWSITTSELNEIAAYYYRIAIKDNPYHAEAMDGLATCLENNAPIQEEDLQGTSYEGKSAAMFKNKPELRAKLVRELRDCTLELNKKKPKLK